MADRGFTVKDYTDTLHVKLVIPAFLKGRDQLSEEELILSQQIASERIHVERMIQRLKTYSTIFLIELFLSICWVP